MSDAPTQHWGPSGSTRTYCGRNGRPATTNGAACKSCLRSLRAKGVRILNGTFGGFSLINCWITSSNNYNLGLEGGEPRG